MLRLFCLMLLIFSSFLVRGQELPVYSTYYFNPFLYNSGYVGNKGGPYFAVNYRRQWLGIAEGPATSTFTFHMPVKLGLRVGLHAYNDSRGILGTNGGLFTLGHGLKLGTNFSASFGLSAGVISQSIDISQVDIGNPALVNLPENNMALDGRFGLWLELYSAQFGISLPHIFDTQIVNPEGLGNVEISGLDNFMVYASYEREVGDALKIKPHLLYYQPQIRLNPIIEGLVETKIKDIISVGVGYRQNYGLIGTIGGNFKFLELQYGYDAASAAIGGFSNASHEIQLAFNFGDSPSKKKKKKVSSFIAQRAEMAAKERERQEQARQERLLEQQRLEQQRRKQREAEQKRQDSVAQVQKSQAKLAQEKAREEQIQKETTVTEPEAQPEEIQVEPPSSREVEVIEEAQPEQTEEYTTLETEPVVEEEVEVEEAVVEEENLPQEQPKPLPQPKQDPEPVKPKREVIVQKPENTEAKASPTEPEADYQELTEEADPAIAEPAEENPARNEAVVIRKELTFDQPEAEPKKEPVRETKPEVKPEVKSQPEKAQERTSYEDDEFILLTDEQEVNPVVSPPNEPLKMKPPAPASKNVVEKGSHFLELQEGTYVVVGTFSTLQNAEEFSDELFDKGYYTKYGYNSEKGLFYVYSFSGDTQAARKERDRLRKRPLFDNAWILIVE